jgi:hypothetical protein
MLISTIAKKAAKIGELGPPIIMGNRLIAVYPSALTTSITLPSGIIAGELLIAFVSCYANGTTELYTASPGWTKVTGKITTSGGLCHAVFVKIASASNSLVVSVDISKKKTSVCYRVKNANTAMGVSNTGSPDGTKATYPSTLNLGVERKFICFASIGFYYNLQLYWSPVSYGGAYGTNEMETSNVETLVAYKPGLIGVSETPDTWGFLGSSTSIVMSTTAVYQA